MLILTIHMSMLGLIVCNCSANDQTENNMDERFSLNVNDDGGEIVAAEPVHEKYLGVFGILVKRGDLEERRPVANEWIASGHLLEWPYVAVCDFKLEQPTVHRPVQRRPEFPSSPGELMESYLDPVLSELLAGKRAVKRFLASSIQNACVNDDVRVGRHDTSRDV